MSTLRAALPGALLAVLLACLTVPLGVVLDVWQQGRDPQGFYWVSLVFGLPIAFLAGSVGLLLALVALRLGVASLVVAVSTGGVLGTLAGVATGSWIIGTTCVLAGLAAGAVWWAALPLPLRRRVSAVA